MNSKETIKLKGLSCAHCAAKIEKSIQELEGVNIASLDFAQGKLSFEVNDSKNKDQILTYAKKIIHDLEPDIDFGEDEEVSFTSSNQKLTNKLIQIILAVSVFAVTFIITNQYIKLVFFIIAYIIVGSDVVYKAYKNILKKEIFDESFLMSLATLGAFAIGEYPEAVAVMLFYKIGEYFQERAVNHSRNSIQSLLCLQIDYAMVIVEGLAIKKQPKEVKIGDILLVKVGDKIPVDGRVIEGYSSVDTSSLTGESLPHDVCEGDFVFGGTLNLIGVLKVEATKKYSESSINKMLELIENASSYKAKTEQFITKFAKVYTPVVVTLALLLVLVPTLIFQEDFSVWLYRALVFLVISCPCALVISIPLGFFGGIGAASKQGILIKGSNYLEALSEIDTIIFDKTGTLTQGKFAIEKIITYLGFSKEEILELAAHAEYYSNHPIAQGIVDEYTLDINQNNITNVNEKAGFGIQAVYLGKQILVGNTKLLKEKGISIPQITYDSTCVYVVVDEKVVGVILVADQLKKDAQETVVALRKLNIKHLLMLSGDKQDVVDSITSKIDLDLGVGELLPHEKVERVKFEIENHHSKGRVAFVGDGINDAAALAHVDVGIAMGALGSDVAIEAADVVLVSDEPLKIAEAISIARYTRKIVTQNIVLALGIKVVFLSLGAAGIATLWEAVFADVGVTILAVLNSMRVLEYKRKIMV